MAIKVSIQCSRCQGKGFLPEFRHVQGGICKRCKGATSQDVVVSIGPNEVRVGTVTFSRQWFARLDRKGLIAVAAANLKPLRHPRVESNGLLMVRLAIVLALAPQDVRIRGMAALAGCSGASPDECALFSQVMNQLLQKRWVA